MAVDAANIDMLTLVEQHVKTQNIKKVQDDIYKEQKRLDDQHQLSYEVDQDLKTVNEQTIKLEKLL